jgi:transcriptional/translational regulatory protein YebC/TACO1
VRDAMEKASVKPDASEITMRAENEISLTGETAQSVAKLLDWLEDLDDVQNVYSNADLPAEAYA